MKRFQRGLVVSTVAALLITSTVSISAMSGNSQSIGTGAFAKAEKVRSANEHETKYKEKENIKAANKENDDEDENENIEVKENDNKDNDKVDNKSTNVVQIQQPGTDSQAKKVRDKIKAATKARYTNEELQNLKLAGDKIKKNYKDVTVLPVENVIVKGVNVKFDTPPVIKYGRTLIPVRALSESFGAEVKWIGDEKKVVITKGDTEIILVLDSNKIFVNGVEATLDVPATTINSRTVVPLSFIVQKLGLKVNWHGDTKDVEIEDPGTPPTTTTGAAIEVNPGSTVDTTNGDTGTNTAGDSAAKQGLISKLVSSIVDIFNNIFDS